MAEKKPVAGPPKKSRLKMIVLLVVVVLLAVALSIAGTLWFLTRSDSGSGGSAETVAAADDFRASLYLEMDRALVTSVRHPGRQRYVQLLLAYESAEQAPLDALDTHMPLVRNELISTLSAMEYMALQDAETRSGLPEVLLATVNRVLEAEGSAPIKRVLLRNFVIQ